MRAVAIRLRWGLVVLLAGAVLLALPSPALAHASLVGSTPTAGARLDELPAQVQLEFSEEVLEPAYVVLTGPDGASAAAGEPQVDGAMVVQATAGGPDGGYTLAYRAVSRDGHPVTGQITFTVGDSTAAPPSATASDRGSSGGGSGDGVGTAAPDREVAVSAPSESGGLGGRTAIVWLVGLGLFGGAAVLLVAARRVG